MLQLFEVYFRGCTNRPSHTIKDVFANGAMIYYHQRNSKITPMERIYEQAQLSSIALTDVIGDGAAASEYEYVPKDFTLQCACARAHACQQHTHHIQFEAARQTNVRI